MRTARRGVEGLANFLQKLLRRVGLAYEGAVFGQALADQHSIVGVTGHIQDAHFAAGAAKNVGEFGAAHFRHDYIGDEQVNRFDVFGGDLHGVGPGVCGEDDVSTFPQNFANQISHDRFILDEQDSFRPSAGCGARQRGNSAFGEIAGTWQVDSERGALAWLAGNRDAASTLFYNAVNGGEAEATALADFLGGEERLENPWHYIGGDAVAGVCD